MFKRLRTVREVSEMCRVMRSVPDRAWRVSINQEGERSFTVRISYWYRSVAMNTQVANGGTIPRAFTMALDRIAPFYAGHNIPPESSRPYGHWRTMRGLYTIVRTRGATCPECGAAIPTVSQTSIPFGEIPSTTRTQTNGYCSWACVAAMAEKSKADWPKLLPETP
jgi:hypothetical protein